MKKSRVTLFAASGLAMAIATAGLLSLTTPASAEDRTELQESPELSVLAQAQTPGDSVPASVDLSLMGSAGVDPDSVRYIETFDSVSYWAGLDTNGLVCVIANFETEDYAASGCAEPGKFNERGLGIQAGSREKAIEVYLIPDYAVTQLEGASISDAPASNLIVADPFSKDREVQSPERSAGAASRTSSGFELLTIPYAFDENE